MEVSNLNYSNCISACRLIWLHDTHILHFMLFPKESSSTVDVKTSAHTALPWVLDSTGSSHTPIIFPPCPSYSRVTLLHESWEARDTSVILFAIPFSTK